VGKAYDGINDELKAWIAEQQMFFVATAPLDENGLVNCSPKGLDSFTVLDDHTVAYLDLTGSGAETIAHLKENGRIVIMFCAFGPTAKIVRLYGRGEVIEPRHSEFDSWVGRFPRYPGARSVIRVRVRRVMDSCGYGVPRYDCVGQRDTLPKWAERKGADGISRYWETTNRRSLDGLPALDAGVNNED